MIYRSKLVEVKTPLNVARGDQYNFENDADLLDVYIIGIESYTVDQVTQAPSGAAVIAAATGLTVTLTEKAQKARQRDTPLSELITSNQGGFIRSLYPYPLNWQDSFITVYDPATFTPGESILFNVHYVPISELAAYEDLYTLYGQ